MNDNSPCLYWIHLDEHTDIFSQGYVGVASTGISKRYREHKCAVNKGVNYPLYNAMRKYPNKIIVDVILKGSAEYCYEMEYKLRPSEKIGCNINIGGLNGTMYKRKHTALSKKKMSESWFKVNTPETVKHRMRNIDRSKPRSMEACKRIKKAKQDTGAWRLKWANKEMWLLADFAFNVMKENPDLTEYGLTKILKTKISNCHSTNLFKKIKQGWNPLQDNEWISWKKKLKGNNYDCEGLLKLV